MLSHNTTKFWASMNELMNIVHDNNFCYYHAQYVYTNKFITEALVNTQLLFLASFFNVWQMVRGKHSCLASLKLWSKPWGDKNNKEK